MKMAENWGTHTCKNCGEGIMEVMSEWVHCRLDEDEGVTTMDNQCWLFGTPAPLGTSLPETAPLDREALVAMLLGYRSECTVSDRWNELAYERADWILAALALPPLEDVISRAELLRFFRAMQIALSSAFPIPRIDLSAVIHEIEIADSVPAAEPVVTSDDFFGVPYREAIFVLMAQIATALGVVDGEFDGFTVDGPEELVEVARKVAARVTQLTREGLNKTIKRLCAEKSTDEFNAFGTFHNGMYALRDALLLAQGDDNGRID